jgi:hypothetical protein
VLTVIFAMPTLKKGHDLDTEQLFLLALSEQPA